MAACIPPELEFFGEPDPAFAVVGPVVDTVLVLRHGTPDSAAAEGVELAFDLLARAEASSRPAFAGVLRRVLEAVPEVDRVARERRGSRDGTILSRVQRQGRLQQLALLRADAVVIRSLEADTVEVESPPPPNDPLADPATHQWLVVVLRGVAVLDPSFGRRTGPEWR